jgi:hypothetical protein
MIYDNTRGCFSARISDEKREPQLAHDAVREACMPIKEPQLDYVAVDEKTQGGRDGRNARKDVPPDPSTKAGLAVLCCVFDGAVDTLGFHPCKPRVFRGPKQHAPAISMLNVPIESARSSVYDRELAYSVSFPAHRVPAREPKRPVGRKAGVSQRTA